MDYDIYLDAIFESIKNAEYRSEIVDSKNKGIKVTPESIQTIKMYDVWFNWYYEGIWFRCKKFIDILDKTVKGNNILGIDILKLKSPNRWEADFDTEHPTELGTRYSQIILKLSDDNFTKIYEYYSKLEPLTNSITYVTSREQWNRKVQNKEVNNVPELFDKLLTND